MMPSDYFKPATSNEAIIWEYFYSVVTDAMLDMMSGADYPKLRICDLGCGDGDFAVHFLTKLKKKHALPSVYSGIDFSKESVESAKNKLTRLFPEVNFDIREGDLLKALPFTPASFDLILSNVVLHNFKDKKTALRNATALLSKSGLFLISDLFHDDGNESTDIKDRIKARKRFRPGLTPQQVEDYLNIATNAEDPRSVAYAFAREFVVGSEEFRNMVGSNDCEISCFTKDAAPFVNIFGIRRQDPLSKYIQEKAIHDLREKNYLSEAVADKFNSGKWLEPLRQHIVPADKTWLIKLASEKNPHLAELCISLMRPVKDESDVRKFLFDTWNDLGSTWYTKMQVMWRLLDYTDLSDDIVESIYQYVKSDWNRWLAYMVEKFGGKEKCHEYCYEDLAKSGGQDDVNDFCNKRLANWIFPESKKWVYLCVLAGSNRIEEVKKVISGYTNSQVSINARVAKDLLSIIA